jgi:hypothetical protein
MIKIKHITCRQREREREREEQVSLRGEVTLTVSQQSLWCFDKSVSIVDLTFGYKCSKDGGFAIYFHFFSAIHKNFTIALSSFSK